MPRIRSAKPGSSKTAPSSKAGRRQLTNPSSDDSDIEEPSAVGNNYETDGEVVEVQPRSKKPPSRGEATINGSGKQVKGKGKAKPVPRKATRKPAPPLYPMDVDHIVIDEDEPGLGPSVAAAVNSSVNNKRSIPHTSRSTKNGEESGLVYQLRQAEAQIATLSQQLEEVFQIRETEAEELLRRQEAQYQAQLQAQESLIKQLTYQLSLKEPLTRTGKTSILNLITREAADQEQRTMEKELARWKDVAEEKEKRIVEKDQRIAELEQREKELSYELNAEIERSKALAAKSSRNPPSVPRGRPGGADDPKHTEVIRFYEDLTNLLVCNMKLQKGKHFSLDEWILSCVYTYTDTDDDAPSTTKSLTFTLRCCHQPADPSHHVESKEQLIPSVNYIPLELDKEPPDYVEKLGFLGTPFTFGREQLPLFLRTLYTSIRDATREDGDGDSSVQIILCISIDS